VSEKWLLHTYTCIMYYAYIHTYTHTYIRLRVYILHCTIIDVLIVCVCVCVCVYVGKAFMRGTVLVSDICVLFPALVLVTHLLTKSKSEGSGITVLLAAVLTPALILIDHGHFQYNGIRYYTHTHTHTYTHTSHIHTYTHTHIHTYI
jgi:hypothetical protein